MKHFQWAWPETASNIFDFDLKPNVRFKISIKSRIFDLEMKNKTRSKIFLKVSGKAHSKCLVID